MSVSSSSARTRSRRGLGASLIAAVLSLGTLACADDTTRAAAPRSGTRTPVAAPAPSEEAAETEAGAAAEAAPDPAPESGAEAAEAEEAAAAEREQRGPEPSDGAARDALLSVPALDLRGEQVVAYRGKTDDARGTVIQNEGVAASPHGPDGGTGPGGIGNYQVTAHRLSAGGIFRYLPELERGDRVRVRAGEMIYVYEIRRTRRTSFRSAESLREQRAAVPGRPGVEATRAMITLSTCRTLEDHAEGNYWSDEFDNPEHRIDKIGVLVGSRRA